MATATLEAPAAKAEAGITIENAGPISGVFKIDLSPGAGVYELTGGKGVGKSTTIKCVESLINGHSTSLSVHDGELGGSVHGFGVISPIASKKRQRGELEINALDTEKYSISDITDPPHKSEAANDAHRIKALASLLRVKPEVSDYYDLVGGRERFEQLVRADKLVTEDPVVLANRIKSELEAAARLAESHADTELGHAQACQERIGEIDLTAASDAKTLNAKVDSAVRLETELKAQAKQAARAKQEIEAARENLTSVQSSYDGPSIEEAKKAHAEADVAVSVASKTCGALESQIKKLQRDLQEAIAIAKEKMLAANTARQAVEAAEQHAKLIENCEKMIASQASIVGVTEPDMFAASKAVSEARSAQEQGVRIRDAVKAKGEQQRFLDSSKASRVEAETLRNAAKGTFDVLAKSVKLDGMNIESVNGDPRLIVEHPLRKGRKTCYGELSDGERQTRAIDMLLPMLGEPAIFVIPQRAWQDLERTDQVGVHEHAKKRGVIVMTARITDGPLNIRFYGKV